MKCQRPIALGWTGSRLGCLYNIGSSVRVPEPQLEWTRDQWPRSRDAIAVTVAPRPPPVAPSAGHFSMGPEMVVTKWARCPRTMCEGQGFESVAESNRTED